MAGSRCSPGYPVPAGFVAGQAAAKRSTIIADFQLLRRGCSICLNLGIWITRKYCLANIFIDTWREYLVQENFNASCW